MQYPALNQAVDGIQIAVVISPDLDFYLCPSFTSCVVWTTVGK